MDNRQKIGGVLKDLGFGNGGMPIVQEKPIRKKLRQLERIYGFERR